MSNATVRIVTRGSKLALTQTRHVAAMLQEKNPGVHFDIATLRTTGDIVTSKPLSQFGGVGVFVKELETALINGDADCAVHSLKDVPSVQPDGLMLACFPEREDPSDVLMTRDGSTIDRLPQGALVGTGSPRRIVQLKAHRPDLRFADLRGNLDTRIAKLDNAEYDAVVVAAAGMRRIGIAFDACCILPWEICLPAPGQGALALECRTADKQTNAVLAALNDPAVALQVHAERVFLRVVNAGCAAPVAALARPEGNGLRMDVLVGDPQTAKIVRHQRIFAIADTDRIATELGELVLHDGRELGIFT